MALIAPNSIPRMAEPGAAFASIRAEGPPAADDIKFTIIANAANPDPP